MAWRFKASKYRNATPTTPKPDHLIRDLTIGSYQTHGNNIACSTLFMAFTFDHSGSNLAVLPLNDSGRKSKLMPLLHAHSDTVTDLDFSPFHDNLLITGSQDCLVKIWCIPEAGLSDNLAESEAVFTHKLLRRIESVGFHPTADYLVHSTSFTALNLWDLHSQKAVFSDLTSHSDTIQSLSWKTDGQLIATTSKDKKLRVLDPRTSEICLKVADNHQSIKDSRVVWLGDGDRVLTSGFNGQRVREVRVWDVRNLGVVKEVEFDCSTGVLMPLFDADTGMLFLAGKGDTTIGYMEVTDKEPYLVEGIRHHGEQTKGACLVPKRALNVMQGEVNRVLQLTCNSVIPITYQVPRKSYRDFHADLYPDTNGCVSHLTAAQWMEGKTLPVPKISLNPIERQKEEKPIIVQSGFISKLKHDHELKTTTDQNQKTEPIKTYVPKIAHTPLKQDFNDFISESREQKSAINKANDENDEDNSNLIKLRGNEGGVKGAVVPPKPLPRASRTGSICESLEEVNSPPKPVARSRTNSCVPVITSVNPMVAVTGGYKPRLGPKPFSPPKFDDSESFDKVFAVPSVPGNQTNGVENVDILNENESAVVDNYNRLQPTDEAEETDICSMKNDININNSSSNGTNFESNAHNDTTDNDDKSTAERRKVFETEPISSLKESDSDNGEILDNCTNFERSSMFRNSIAERRKIYERSLSAQETREESPNESTAVSVKNRKNAEEPEENRKFARQQSLDPQVGKNKAEAINIPTPKRTSTVFGKVSKFRHLKGTTAHKSLHIENLRNLSRQIPGECDGFHANSERAATPLSGPGGKIAVLELTKTGKLPDGVIPTLVQGTNVMDFAFDPFNDQRLIVACDDGLIKIWEIPEKGLKEPTNEPTSEFNAHPDKIYFVKFNPVAKDVLATGSYDTTVRVFDLTDFSQKICLLGHSEQIFAFAWSPCGKFCATVSKDAKIRIYDPRNSDLPIREGNGPVGSRGARVVWALNGAFLVVTGFDKVSERQIMVFNAMDLKAPLNVVGLDVSPAILVPFYDEDSSTLFLTGRGDSTIYTFEITEEHPYICPLSHHRCNSLNQGLSFLPKISCDVTNVEFAKALRLTNNSIEPLSFTVPRIKTDLFQDDLFPPTRMTWKPLLSAMEWFSGKEATVQRVSLQPEGMESLSSYSQQAVAEKQAKSSPKFSRGGVGVNMGNVNRLGWDTEMKAKQDEIKKSVSKRLPVNMKLEQDSMEGVDEKEWEE